MIIELGLLNPPKNKRVSLEKGMSSSQDNLSSKPHIQSALFDIAKLLNASGLDLKTVVKKVLKVILTLIECEKCSLFLLNKETRELYDIAFDLDSKSDGRKGFAHLTIPLGQGIAGKTSSRRHRRSTSFLKCLLILMRITIYY